jgi:hypothetical protein
VPRTDMLQGAITRLNGQATAFNLLSASGLVKSRRLRTVVPQSDCNGRGKLRTLRLSSKVIIRTHKHRSTNKREPLLRSNQWRRVPLVHC